MSSAEWGSDLLNKVAAEHYADEQEPVEAEDEDPEESPEPDEATTEADPGEPAAAPETEEEPGEEEPEPPALTSDSWEYDNGLRIDRDQARVYAEFEQFLIANPTVAQAISDAINTPSGAGAQPTGDTVTPQPPEGLDLEDPAIRLLWEEIQTQRQAVDRASELISRHEQQLTQQNQATTDSLINRASMAFAKDHDLSNDEMVRVRDAAGRLQVLPSLMAAIDPFTGKPRRVDPMAAIEEAFNIAYWQLPELREREIQRVTKRERDDRKRKGKLAALGGTSGSVPRQVQVSNDPNARRQAMIAEVAGMMETPS